MKQEHDEIEDVVSAPYEQKDKPRASQTAQLIKLLRTESAAENSADWISWVEIKKFNTIPRHDEIFMSHVTWQE